MKKRAKILTAVEEKLVARDISPYFGIVANWNSRNTLMLASRNKF